MFYGAVKNAATGEEYFWDAASLAEVQSDLRKLRGTVYGLHWTYAGDQGYQESNIHSGVLQATFYGRNAVKQVLAL